ncbi:MAG: EamA family transporter RarD [Rhodospirillales bacterium]|nr:EamA family transporter RarD [Rhodospirillales bacterium]
MPVYFKAVDHVLPSEVAAHRILWSMALLGILLIPFARWPRVWATFASRPLMLRLAASAMALSGSWLVYIWAIANDRIVESSLGYFINPLFNVMLGVLLLKEGLRRWQWVAVGLAAAGVGVLVVQQGAIPWVALALPLTFGMYGLLRKTTVVDPMAGLFVETLLVSPLAIVWLLYLASQGMLAFAHTGVATDALLLLTSVITVGPLLLFIQGARRLTLATLGFFQYLAPTGNLLFGVFAYGEPFTPAHQAAFGLIWIALAVYMTDAMRARVQPAVAP